MKDIPVFTTDNGVASLALQGVPIWKSAYIKILSSAEPFALLEECVDFCKMCGAEEIYASGNECLGRYPCSTVLVQMQRMLEGMEETDACVFPMTDRTVGQWREIYNHRMATVPNASYMTWADEKKFLTDGDCYFVHKDGQLLGIGKASGDMIHALASVQPGAGREVVLALASLISGDRVKVIVAQQNKRAVSLYEQLGFAPVSEVSRWYKIL